MEIHGRRCTCGHGPLSGEERSAHFFLLPLLSLDQLRGDCGIFEAIHRICMVEEKVSKIYFLFIAMAHTTNFTEAV